MYDVKGYDPCNGYQDEPRLNTLKNFLEFKINHVNPSINNAIFIDLKKYQTKANKITHIFNIFYNNNDKNITIEIPHVDLHEYNYNNTIKYFSSIRRIMRYKMIKSNINKTYDYSVCYVQNNEKLYDIMKNDFTKLLVSQFGDKPDILNRKKLYIGYLINDYYKFIRFNINTFKNDVFNIIDHETHFYNIFNNKKIGVFFIRFRQNTNNMSITHYISDNIHDKHQENYPL